MNEWDDGNFESRKFWKEKVLSFPLRRALCDLDLLEQIALYLRFWEAHTIEEVGDQLSLTWSKADKLLNSALDRLRVKICGDDSNAIKQELFKRR